MSGQLESALVLSLTDTIKWESALGPVGDTGVMATVDPAAPLDVTQYGRRDRELAYRDLINAAAILKVSLEIETVFGGSAIRPKVEGLTTEILPTTLGDLGAVNSKVVHVKNSSLPIDALSADKDLAGRDALLYEVLSRACRVFSADPPLTPNDPNSVTIPDTTAWSKAEALANRNDINPALTLNTNAFKLPDRNLADRDNQIAAYVSRLCQILKNPFEFADRLYVSVDSTNSREYEVYALIREYWDASTTYFPGDEVYHSTGWWRALQYTSSEPDLNLNEWLPISTQSNRIYQADPNLIGRNRIVYNTELKTLQWVSESLNEVHIPQIFALVIPGPQIGQLITTYAKVPEAKDCEFWRQKSGRISYAGTLAQHVEGYHNTTAFQTGVIQSDTTGLTGPGKLTFPFGARLMAGHPYRFSALVKPSQEVTILGGYNSLALPGTLSGVTFTGDYQPSPGVAGEVVPFAITLPSGGWELVLNYTDLEALTDGFGTKITNNGVTVMEDAAPLLFQNQNGIKYGLGEMIDSNPILFTSSGGVNNFNIQWTYGDGLFHIRQLTFTTRDRKIARYSMQVNVKRKTGGIIISRTGTLTPAVDTWGERNVYGVMPFDFTPTETSLAPNIVLKWLPESDCLPLQVRQIQLQKVINIDASPEFGGFLSWKQECLYRALRAVSTSHSTFVAQTEPANMPDFTLDGTRWDKTSTNAWMTAIETYQPRLRHVENIGTDAVIASDKYYRAGNGVIVYNGGTYTDSQKFWGTHTASSFISYANGTVDQEGAFMLSLPGHIGRPALIPLGLYYDNTNVRMTNPTARQTPVLTVCQPWMIEAGVYVAQQDFWSPETVISDVEVVTSPSDRYPDNSSLSTEFGDGSYDEVVYTNSAAEIIEVWSGSLSETVHVRSGGTHSGTTSISIWSGSFASVVEVESGGTHSGTVGIEIWSGSIVTAVETTTGGTHSGTVGIEIWSGSFATTSVYGGDYTEDYGTVTVAFGAGNYATI